MSNAPDRIWATEDKENFGEDRFHSTFPMKGLTEYGLNVSFPGVGALFDRHLITANLALDDVHMRAVVCSLRALDQTDGGNRCNRLPCDWRGAIIATGGSNG